jgi:hypothetical protein
MEIKAPATVKYATVKRSSMIESLIKHLERNAKLENSIDVERFDATLSQIADANDPQAIGLLLPFLNDECEFKETMFSIIHTIERFDDRIYVREIIRGLPKMWSRSPYWTKVIHFRIFNHAPSCQAYRKELAHADASIKATAKELFTTISNQQPKFVDACNELLAVL